MTSIGSFAAKSWTKSHVPREITGSRYFRVRARTVGSSAAIRRGVNAFETRRRSFCCRGGSIAMIIGGRAPEPRSSDTPSADENVSHSWIAFQTSWKRDSA